MKVDILSNLYANFTFLPAFKQAYMIIVESNLSYFQTTKENMVKLLNQNYKVEIFYNDFEQCFYTLKKESQLQTGWYLRMYFLIV